MTYKIPKTLLCTTALTLFAGTAQADFLINDDLIVDGSACIGFDCVNGESFSFDTIRMKENNLRIKAQDTSAASSFPSNDWLLIFNDSANGGANKFAVQDVDANREVFVVEAGARSNALYVDNNGNIGRGTSNPVLDLHVVDGDSPGLRLEQNGSSGFAPQTWDVAGNETNFFVRDVSNGSLLPFRIRPGADGNSLFIENNGDVGMGTASPSESLHVRSTAGDAKLLVEEASGTDDSRGLMELRNNGTVFFTLTDTSIADVSGSGREWNFQNQDGTFRVTTSPGGPGDIEMILTQDGDLTIEGELTTTGGTCGGGCDLVFTDAYDLPTIAEHQAKMWDLGYLPNVGPTIENAPINISDKVGRMLNELEHAHIFIGQQHETITSLTADVEALTARLAVLEQTAQE